MSKDTLLKHLTSRGKDMSWDGLAAAHKIKDGEKARQIWKTYRLNNGLGQEALKELTAESKKEKLAMWAAMSEPQKRAKIRTAISETIEHPKAHHPMKTHLLEISIPDLHVGKMSWDKETGEDYDIEIACKRYREAVMSLATRTDAAFIERILLPIGNDLLNVDNKMNTTTAGTPQSSDSRFGKIFRTVKNLMVETIDALSAIAPVDVLIVPGNHDEATMFTLGELLDVWYKDSIQVKIYNSPKLRKYYEYGQNMIMFTHGDKEKHAELGQIAAHEEAQMWGRTKYREVHLGHYHRSKTISYTTGDEYPGFKIRILPSLCGSDAWHYAQGYMSAKAAKAFVWQKDQGLITEHTYNL